MTTPLEDQLAAALRGLRGPVRSNDQMEAGRAALAAYEAAKKPGDTLETGCVNPYHGTDPHPPNPGCYKIRRRVR